MNKLLLTAALLLSTSAFAFSTGPDGSTVSGTSGIASKLQVAMMNESLREFLATGEASPFAQEAIELARIELSEEIGVLATEEITDREIVVGIFLSK